MKKQQTTLPPAHIERGSLTQWKDYRDFAYLALSAQDQKKWSRTAPWNSLCVFICGYYAEAFGHKWERRGRDEAVLIYCTAGKGFFRLNNREWTILPGDVLYCPPYAHYTHGADPKDPWTIYWMHLRGKHLNSYRNMLGLSAEQPVRPVGIRPMAIAGFKTLFHFMNPPINKARMSAINNCAGQIIACLAIETGEETSSEQIGTNIQRVIDFMRNHIPEKADLPAWLRLFKGSRSHFARQFKRATGYAPNDYFLRMKISKASSLLATSSDLPVRNIAEQVGINDPYYFSRQFRRITGTSPSEYRNNTRLQHNEM